MANCHNIIMDKKKDITVSAKQKLTKRLSDGMTSLNNSKQLGQDHRTLEKTIEDITKNRKPRSGKRFKNLSMRDKFQLKRIVAKNPLLGSDKLFNIAGIVEVKRVKRCSILRDIGFVKKISSPASYTSI
ncbi:Hypothetical predicted protein [Octopus vulgaris]|uniref:Uncharacterized protein n=1 Tax=Octopus vulgaris TaxID=6645 RepID=A0AA36ALK1_OCTVU|nr:Hypothetical predicted protein [Octopus vulgaris]